MFEGERGEEGGREAATLWGKNVRADGDLEGCLRGPHYMRACGPESRKAGVKKGGGGVRGNDKLAVSKPA